MADSSLSHHSEVLCFTLWSLDKRPKDDLIRIIGNFYHEDELCASKLELWNAVTSTADRPDGWSKYAGAKGNAPVVRRGTPDNARRMAEADDIVNMLLLLDVKRAALPKYYILDLSRVPPRNYVANVSDESVIASKLQDLESRMLAVSSDKCDSVTGLQRKIDNLELKVSSQFDSISADMARMMTALETVVNAKPCNNQSSITGETSEKSTELSWAARVEAAAASQSNSSAVRQPMVRSTVQPAVRPPSALHSTQEPVRYVVNGTRTRQSGLVKSIPRQAVCFVGRLDIATSENDLAEYLRDVGIPEAQCRKLKPKDGREYRTAAFRVACDAKFNSILFAADTWPEGAVVREWFFRQ